MPIRNNQRLLLRPRITLLASVAIASIGVTLGSAWASNAVDAAATGDYIKYQAVRSDLPDPYRDGCDTFYDSAKIDACEYGSARAPHTAVLLADSVGTQWFSAFEAKYATNGWRLIVLTKSSCPIVDQPIFNPKIKAIYAVCETWRNSALEYLLDEMPDIVFIGSSATYDLTSEQWVSGTKRVLGKLEKAATQVLIIKPTPLLAFDGPNCLGRRESQPNALVSLSDCISPVSTNPDQAVLAALREASAGFANVRILDFNELVCPGGICRAESYRDNTHITDKFVKSISKQVGEIIDQAQ